MLGEKELALLRKQGYHIVGSHSAVKPCKWLVESIRTGGECYKHQFYDIQSHRCVQCTPALQFCTHSCLFCWRVLDWDAVPNDFKWDEPSFVASEILREHLRIISGHGGNAGADMKKAKQAWQPKHVALSLAGEPLLYPYLGELISEFHKRKMTTFVVSNGTLPERMRALTETSLPTQFYISMTAPNKEAYAKTCRPMLKDSWQKIKQSRELMKGLKGKTRTVLRMTLARSLNFSDVKGYAEQVAEAEPDYVEVKSFMFVGGSRYGRGLSLDDMIAHTEIKEFASKLAKETGYLVTDEHKPSRIVLLCRDKDAEKRRKIELE